MPDLELLLEETNTLLARNGLPPCESVSPISDTDTANPIVIAIARHRRFVVKVTTRHPDTLNRQLEVANKVRTATDLPIPKHFCCAEIESNLPLMVMEWLPGDQLRNVLAEARSGNLLKLCISLANCLSTFHDPVLIDITDETETDSGFPLWLYDRTVTFLDNAPRQESDHSFKKNEVAAIRQFLEARLVKMDQFAIPSLVKVDIDLRDYLADPIKFEITGMLDWERVTRGDGIYAIVVTFLRLWINHKLEGWQAFLETYNQFAKVHAEACPQAEFYLMCRAVIACEFNRDVKGIVSSLLKGNRLPFAT